MTRRTVYVGIDVHRKRSQAAVVTEDGTVQLNKNVVNGTARTRT
jgi:transposase